MLQSEFFDRTKVSLTAEEYADVERIYNEVTMNKDDFCRLWLAIRNNPLYIEMAAAIIKLQKDCIEAADAKEESIKDYVEAKMKYQTDLDEQEKDFQKKFEAFGRDMVVYEENDVDRYEAIEKMFGLGFICRIKLEEDYDLDKNEREYLIKQLG